MEIDFKVPPDWQVLEIREIGEVVTGRTPSTKREDFYGGEYKLISPNDLDNGKYVTTAHRLLTSFGLRECRALPKNTVLVGCIGNVGKLGMVQDANAATNQQINAVICNQNNDPHYVYYSFYANRYRLERAADKTTVPILNKTNFEAFTIPVPSLREQRKIAAVLGLVQRAVEQQKRLLAMTAELKKTLLHRLFTHGLRNEPQKQTEIGPMPQSWDVKPLGDFLAEAQYGLSVKGGRGGNYPLLRMTNQRDGRIVEDNLQYVDLCDDEFERFRVARQDVLFNRTNSLELVGRTAIFELAEDFVFASYLIRLRTDPERLRPHFLNCYFNADKTQVRLKSIATRAVSQSNISATRLRGFPIVVPSTSEQDEIVDTIESVDRKLSIHRRKHAGLSDLFGRMLHELMSARIRVKDVDLSMLHS
jgi:type I restriction enzyme S subunit